MTRTEKALMGNFPPVAPWFQHSVTPGQPTGPSTATLTQPDLDRFNLWYANRVNGSTSGTELDNMTPALQAMIASYETYFATPAFVAWAATDVSSRIMQWRLIHVDIAESVNTAGTIPPSYATNGIGTGAPGMGNIIYPSQSMSAASGDQVSTGGASPEIVFGDDGDIVTTGET